MPYGLQLATNGMVLEFLVDLFAIFRLAISPSICTIIRPFALRTFPEGISSQPSRVSCCKCFSHYARLASSDMSVLKEDFQLRRHICQAAALESSVPSRLAPVWNSEPRRDSSVLLVISCFFIVVKVATLSVNLCALPLILFCIHCSSMFHWCSSSIMHIRIQNTVTRTSLTILLF
jgi:hypothetical protein